MDKFLKEILSKESSFARLTYIREEYSNLFNNQQEQLSFIKALASTHNERKINLFDIFRNGLSTEKHSFFTYQSIWSTLVEYLESPILEMFRLCIDFNKMSGSDGVSWISLNALERLCSSDQEKSEELFNIIINDLEDYRAYLVFGLRIISKHNFERARDYIVSQMLTDHNMVADALFGIGRLHFHSTLESNYFIEILNENCSNASDENLARILDSACSIYSNNFKIDGLEGLIEIIRTHPNIGNHVAHTASTQLFNNGKNFTKEISIEIINFIKYCKKDDLNTLQEFGLFISNNLGSDIFSHCLDIIEFLLINKNIKIESFGISYYLLTNVNVLNRIITRWYLSSNINLQYAATELISSENNLKLAPDYSICDRQVHEKDYFLTKKVIGWLYVHSETVSYFLVNIINQANHAEVDRILNFILNNFLIDYNGKPREILLDENKYNNSEIKDKILNMKEKHEHYYKLLNDTSKIKELYVPLAHREAHYRLEHKKMTTINKISRAKSSIASLFTTQVLLYGNSSIYHIQDGSGKEHRQEMQLGSHSYSIELPRRGFVDSEGLELNLRILRTEK